MNFNTIVGLFLIAGVFILSACNSNSVLPKDELGVQFQSEIIQMNDSEKAQFFPQVKSYRVYTVSPAQPPFPQLKDSAWIAFAASFDMDNLNPELNHAYSMDLQFWKKEALSDLILDSASNTSGYKDPEIFFERFLDKKTFPNLNENMFIKFRQTYQFGNNERFPSDFNHVSIKKVKRVNTDEGDRLQIEGEFQCQILGRNPFGAEWFKIENGVFRVQMEP